MTATPHEPILFSDEESEDEVLTEAKSLATDYLPVFTHEDGSLTVIVNDPDREHANPREDDVNIAHLVVKHRDYSPIDEPDSGIEEARERFEGYGHTMTTAPTWGRGADSRHDQEYMVNRYVAMFRPDIAAYEHEWTVSGHTQGDWSYGYAYVLKSEYDAAFTEEWVQRHPDDDLSPAGMIKQEVDVYEKWFRGDVYGAHHLWRGDPIVAFGEQGAYITGYRVEEESVWGFLGYADEKDIAAEMTASPIVDRDVY